ncbi:hypothetical protein K2173_014171 [Erythroxylum novogranatense]|uniref:Replication factor C subunit 1 n=1 Tax=Erythroxylum novogranatense TaxID=1862640 RepID=A0AAV8SDZ5_9ROSI|nr:hypothetical protein K2173_014171 [Erythroxylum novogranatense]
MASQQQRDIRKWLMKPHDKDKGNGNAVKPAQSSPNKTEQKPESKPEMTTQRGQESSGRRKTSKYFAADKQEPKDEKEVEELPLKRKTQSSGEKSVKLPPSKKVHKVDESEDDDDFVMPNKKSNYVDVTPSKKLKSSTGRGVAQKSVNDDEGESDDDDGIKDADSLKSGGRSHSRGRGGRGASTNPSGGRGRGGGRGFMNFDRKDPPHKGEKEVPEGAPDCLAGLTFVISGTLDSLEREEAEDLIKRHGGRVTGSVSKKTNYLLCDEDIEGRKSSKAKELGTPFLSEDGLFDMIRASKGTKGSSQNESKESVEEAVSVTKKGPKKAELKGNSLPRDVAHKSSTETLEPTKLKEQAVGESLLSWTEKYRPKSPTDIVGNQSVVNQLHNWLKTWHAQFLEGGNKGKGKKQNDPNAKKAVLLSGTPGIGKTTSAKLVAQMLGFQAIEVNASDSRGKADAKIYRGIGGSNANCIKELVSNEALGVDMDRSKHPKTVLIMDEVDGMSAGDRGGVADLIASIKISKVPIICICNDRYSQKLKSLLNYCLLLNFRKPTKQQMAKRLMQVAKAEGLQANEIALEELAERVNGDMRMAINQLQYMSLSMSIIKYDDVRQRLLNSAKDEDISPFTAVDKLFGFGGGKLRMDERIDLSMSDPDLVPLIVQENYINYRPCSVSKDDDGLKRMRLVARAAESIADGDIINVQIRRNRQWQLSQISSLSSCIIPAALMHGQRETLEPGERNFNRFGGWLGKNSTTGKNLRLLENLHVHLLASRESNLGRETLRLEYFPVILKHLTDPLRLLPKDEAVEKVVQFMTYYSITQEDYDTVVELSKFQGHANPLDGIASTVKAALTRAYKEENKSRMVRSADLVPLPGIKKTSKKRIVAAVEPSDDALGEENGDLLAEKEEESFSDTDELGNADKKLQDELQSLKSKGIDVEMEIKDIAHSSAKKTPAGRGRGGSTSGERKPGGRGRGGSGSTEKAGGKRKR